MRYAIRWMDGAGGPFVTNRQTNRYTIHVKDAKTWKTRAAAERFLSLKDAKWASRCEIVEIKKES